MPSKNAVKQYDAPAFYHVYNRGAGGQRIFVDSSDKRKCMSLFERHLSAAYAEKHPESLYEQYDVELTAFCLMGNHFHLLLYQGEDPAAITALMKSVSTAYAMYFNTKYKRQGHLFQSIFRASRITGEAYLAHITRYIHLNPRTYKTYHWSSLAYFFGKRPADWVVPERVVDMTAEQYAKFLEDYESRRDELAHIKKELEL